MMQLYESVLQPQVPLPKLDTHGADLAHSVLPQRVIAIADNQFQWHMHSWKQGACGSGSGARKVLVGKWDTSNGIGELIVHVAYRIPATHLFSRENREAWFTLSMHTQAGGCLGKQELLTILRLAENNDEATSMSEVRVDRADKDRRVLCHLLVVALPVFIPEQSYESRSSCSGWQTKLLQECVEWSQPHSDIGKAQQIVQPPSEPLCERLRREARRDRDQHASVVVLADCMQGELE